MKALKASLNVNKNALISHTNVKSDTYFYKRVG